MYTRQLSIWTWTCGTSAAPSAKLIAVPSAMQGAQKKTMFNQTVLNFQQQKR